MLPRLTRSGVMAFVEIVGNHGKLKAVSSFAPFARAGCVPTEKNSDSERTGNGYWETAWLDVIIQVRSMSCREARRVPLPRKALSIEPGGQNAIYKKWVYRNGKPQGFPMTELYRQLLIVGQSQVIILVFLSEPTPAGLSDDIYDIWQPKCTISWAVHIGETREEIPVA